MPFDFKSDYSKVNLPFIYSGKHTFSSLAAGTSQDYAFNIDGFTDASSPAIPAGIVVTPLWQVLGESYPVGASSFETYVETLSTGGYQCHIIRHNNTESTLGDLPISFFVLTKSND